MSVLDRLDVDLVGNDLLLKFVVGGRSGTPTLVVSSRAREAEARFAVNAIDDGRAFSAVVDLRRVASLRELHVEQFDLELEWAANGGEVRRQKLGRAASTFRPLRGLQQEIDDVTVRMKLTPRGYLSLVVGVLRPVKLGVGFRQFRPQANLLDLECEVRSGVAIAKATLVAIERTSGTQVATPLAISCDPEVVRTEYGRLTYTISGRVEMRALQEGLPSTSEVVPLELLLVDEYGAEHRHAVELPADDRLSSLATMTAVKEDRVSQFVPYRTFKASKVSLRVEHFDPDAYSYLCRVMKWAWLMPLLRRFIGVWLVGELANRAQDNGYHFFEWVRTNHPRRRIYYVVSADSPDRARVEALGNVVIRGSREHVWRSLLATRLISTHLPQYLLPTHDRRMERWASGGRVFLQHGVLGLKNMVANYGRRASDFRTDRFHVSSAREREIVINDFGYRPGQVRVTGLPRFDALLAPGEEPSGILIIPTWREWLIRPERVAGSDFLQQWHDLLGHQRIQDMLAEGERITFILHPNLTHHTSLIDAPDGVTVMTQGECDVQQLLREHRALITDYSSVGFDFALQGRPVYYFQFDRDRFLGRFASHIDPVVDLPGFVATEVNEVLDRVVKDRSAGFAMPEENRRRIERAIDHVDRHNCARVYRSVKRGGGPLQFWNRMRDSDRAGRVYEWFRSSALYRPAMMAMMALARMLPRSSSAVFESGSGRQYGGNPRAIYEELARRESGVRTVWSSTSTFRPLDLNTRKVQPRTPRYYWELGRARYWISDQNLGVDVRPSKRTFYLQTWHGTPLKRMQHDAVSQVGREPGYLERVSQQTGYWSALLSPSAPATERMRSAFRFDGEIVELGYPRNDVLADPVARAQRSALVRQRLGIAPDCRLILYAPTFRDNAKKGSKAHPPGGLDLAWLAGRMPDDCLLLVRAHQVAGRSMVGPPDEGDSGRVVDVTRLDDAQDLLAVADVLITDYSSMFYDFALTRRPMLFYCPDLETYRDEVRGFYADYEEEVPGPVLSSGDQLVAALQDLPGVAASYQEEIEAFVRRFGPMEDGQAAARIVDNLMAR